MKSCLDLRPAIRQLFVNEDATLAEVFMVVEDAAALERARHPEMTRQDHTRRFGTVAAMVLEEWAAARVVH